MPVLAGGEDFEIVDREEVDVGRVVPVVGEEFGLGRAAVKKMGEADGLVAVRTRGGQDLGQMSVDALIRQLQGEVAARSGTA